LDFDESGLGERKSFAGKRIRFWNVANSRQLDFSAQKSMNIGPLRGGLAP
jgi:hypothetical protein